MDPAEISTLSQLADALSKLRRERSLSLQALADAAKKLPARGGRRPALPRSTANDLLNAKSVPEAETVVTFLAACGIHEEEVRRPWQQALERVPPSTNGAPPGAARVRDARPRVLGVHAAIQTAWLSEHAASGPGEAELPLYVPRAFDADLRTKLTLASQQGRVCAIGRGLVGREDPRPVRGSARGGAGLVAVHPATPRCCGSSPRSWPGGRRCGWTSCRTTSTLPGVCRRDRSAS